MTSLTRWSPGAELRPFSRDPLFHRLWNLMDWDFERGEAGSWIPDLTVLETTDELSPGPFSCAPASSAAE